MRTSFVAWPNSIYSIMRKSEPPRLAAIVGGHGEVEAVPVLIRRIAREIDPGLIPEIKSVIRVPESKLIKPRELERAVDLASRRLEGRGGIFILLDCDDGCPATAGPELLKRASSVNAAISVSVVLAKREFESWFLAAARSLSGRRSLPSDLTPPSDPEAIRGAKEWLTDKMGEGQSYSETTDQPALTDLFNMQVARCCDSFDKCRREIERLLKSVR